VRVQGWGCDSTEEDVASLRLNDLLGPVTRVKKKKEKPEGRVGGPGKGHEDFMEKGFQFKTFLAMKFTTQHDLY